MEKLKTLKKFQTHVLEIEHMQHIYFIKFDSIEI
jgi:hypothetical protein